MKIAMWSGPRNLSTAMMYSFAARGDCTVWDEPFYAAFLAATGIDHMLVRRNSCLRRHPRIHGRQRQLAAARRLCRSA